MTDERRPQENGDASDWGAPPPEVARKVPNEAPGFFARPGRARMATIVLIVVCLLLAVADLLYHKHPYFGVEHAFNFYGFYGFLSCVGLVLAAKLLRILVKRSEDHYDR